MPQTLVECPLNFSEGQRQDVIASIKQAALRPGVDVLDISSDADHNRSVITIIGRPKELEESVLSLVARAIELIDLRQQRGTHPRVGAVDVVPFVPVRGATMAQCVDMARRVGERIGRELQVPVYLYEKAATAPHRRNLAEVRAGEFEGLPAKMQDPLWKPDFGPGSAHPSAGAVVVGARTYLVAYNVYLGTKDLQIGKAIAHALRARDGGLANVKALGMFIKERDMVQISMNLVDPFHTPIYRVIEAVRTEARRYGVPVVESELIGLLPLETLLETARYYLQLPHLRAEHVLETRVSALGEE
jgi:glutamate formiminotransferase / 5-formyltetrahydrofolate cyclo-ligase